MTELEELRLELKRQSVRVAAQAAVLRAIVATDTLGQQLIAEALRMHMDGTLNSPMPDDWRRAIAEAICGIGQPPVGFEVPQ